MTITDKASLFALARKVVKVTIDDLGEDVYIRKITGVDRQQFFDLIKKSGTADEAENSLDVLVGMGLSDEAGNRLFNTDELDEISKLPLDLLRKLVVQILEHNGLGNNSVDTTKKNLKKSTTSTSSSASSENSEE